jgi:hypothetical protein
MLRLDQGLKFKSNNFLGLIWSLIRALTHSKREWVLGSNLGEPALELVPSPFE